MSSDQVRSIVEANFPMLTVEERNNPNGYAFFLGAPRRGGSESNRIIRAVQYSENGPVKLKLAISSRIEDKNNEINFDGDVGKLVKLIELEIKLYEEHFGKA